MNSAPDFDVTSLGEGHFRWVVGAMAELCVALARQGRAEPRLRWDAFL